MTEITIPVEPSPQEPGVRDLIHPRVLLFMQLALLAAAVLVSILTRHTASWNLPYLAVLIVLSALSDLMSARLPSGVTITGSFLGIVLAAVLLGGPPAAIVGTVTIVIGWTRSRESGELFRQNL